MTRRRPRWLVPAALVALGTVPVIAGSLRLAALSVGVAVIPSDARYTASPVPVVLHIVSAPPSRSWVPPRGDSRCGTGVAQFRGQMVVMA